MMVGFGHVVHHIAKGISKRTVRIPWPDLRARLPRAFLYSLEGIYNVELTVNLLASQLVSRGRAFVLWWDITGDRQREFQYRHVRSIRTVPYLYMVSFCSSGKVGMTY